MTYDKREQERIRQAAQSLIEAFAWSESEMGFSFWNLIHELLIEEMKR